MPRGLQDLKKSIPKKRKKKARTTTGADNSIIDSEPYPSAWTSMPKGRVSKPPNTVRVSSATDKALAPNSLEGLKRNRTGKRLTGRGPSRRASRRMAPTPYTERHQQGDSMTSTWDLRTIPGHSKSRKSGRKASAETQRIANRRRLIKARSPLGGFEIKEDVRKRSRKGRSN